MNTNNLTILGIGISEHKCDGVLRFEHFCQAHQLEYQIVGDGQVWRGGDMAMGPGGGQKINQLVSVIKDMDNRLIIVCDTFDLYPVAGPTEIIRKFNKLCKPNQVLFSAEVFCWPDKSLASMYPAVNTKYKYLNSGCIMGYRNDIYQLITNSTSTINSDNIINDNDDDQLFFTRKFLNGIKLNHIQSNHIQSNHISIVLDYKCELFQALNGAIDDVVLFKNRVYNKYTNTYPVFIHGNGPAKAKLNYLENYIESNILAEPIIADSLTKVDSALPQQQHIFMALYIDSSEDSQLKIFMDHIVKLDYSTINITIHIYDRCINEYDYDKLINSFLKLFPNINIVYHWNIFGYVFTDFKKAPYDYYFLVEQRCIITNQHIIQDLINLCDVHHRIISPLLASTTNPLFTNFWGALDSNGYYDRSIDYKNLINYVYRGLWNVPYVSGVVLFDKSIILNWNLDNNLQNIDIDMNLCKQLRSNTLFMYMSNIDMYGYLC